MKFTYEIHNTNNISFQIRDSIAWGAHIHKEVELVYVIEGNPTAYIQGIKYNIKPGEGLVVYPNQVHSYEDNGIFKGSVLIFDPKLFPEFNSIINGKVPLDPIANAQTLKKQRFDILHNNLYANFFDCQNEAVKKGSLLVTAGILLSSVTLENAKFIHQSIFDNIFQYCFTHYSSECTLKQMSEELSLSYSYLSHLFSERIHMSFNDYLNSIRINHACNLLNETELSITEIAISCGFSTIRTFNRAFLKLTGKKPREYKNGR